MANPVQLRVIAEKTLHSPANPDLLAYSPSMELLAVGGADHNVLIYRLNGQRVFSASQKVKGVVLELQKLVWKPNGIVPCKPPLTSSLTYGSQAN
jgi:anaphase-promoting complex subunit 4